MKAVPVSLYQQQRLKGVKKLKKLENEKVT